MAAHNELGKKGEDAACQYLEQRGYVIKARNWRCDRHEIDIVAEGDAVIIFVEVKTRTSSNWGLPVDFVSKKQMKRIVEAADFYLRENDISKDARFDILSVLDKKSGIEIEHIDDAFLAGL